MKLTQLEVDALQHRLDLDDCIVEVLADSGFGEKDVCDSIGAICVALTDRRLPSAMNATDVAVLVELIEGSTWCAVHENELGNKVSQQKYNAVIRSFKNLAVKVSKHVGFEIKRVPII